MLSLSPAGVQYDGVRCCQCGVCLSSCPYGALSAGPPDSSGVARIECDPDRCVRCGRCVQVCPAHELPNDRVDEKQVLSAPGCYLSHAVDSDVRWMASSGGAGRALVSGALEAGAVDAVYTLAYPDDGGTPMPQEHARQSVLPTGQEVCGTWWTRSPPQERIPCSIYRPVLWGREVGHPQADWRRVLLMGLPCQIKGAKALLRQVRPDLEVLSTVLLCRQQKTLDYTRRSLALMGVPAGNEMSRVTYRGEGWPGLIRQHPGDKTVPFLHTGFAFGDGLGIWTLPACDYCANPSGLNSADICLADPWGLILAGMDPLGSNVLFIWTEAGQRLLGAVRSRIRLYDLEAEKALKVLDAGRIRRKVGSIQCRMEPELADKRFRKQENGRTRQQIIFRHLHPSGSVWKSIQAVSSTLRSFVLFVFSIAKDILRLIRRVALAVLRRPGSAS